MIQFLNDRLSPAPNPLRVVVVGGGPAGMMAAGIAALRGHRVTLFEPQAVLGRKLRITGKGRCNLCNRCDVPAFLEQVRRNPRFLRSALSQFTPADTETFFEALGVPVKAERGSRVFPQSDSAHQVADALARFLGDAGVEIRKNRVTAVLTDQGVVTAVRCADDAVFSCDRVILATGGLSYPKTGSTGDGYRMARRCGHTIVPTGASLVPFVSPDPRCAAMQGLSLRNVTLLMTQDGKKVFSGFGELLFTHFGVSGPLILSASAYYRPGVETMLSVDLKPALDEPTLDRRILRDFEKNRNRAFQNALGDLLHKKMIPVIIASLPIAPETRVHSITAAQRKALLGLVKNFEVRVSGTRPIEEAVITAGGVSVAEVNPRELSSKLVSGLFFAGELLDADAFTGGYNLQICWSTGFAAGAHV